MSPKQGFWSTKAVKYTLQFLMSCIGFFLLMLQLQFNIFDMSGSVWNARLYSGMAIVIICMGFALPGRDLEEKLYRFFVAFGITVGIWFALGGFLLTNDIMNDTDYSGGNIWIAFDLVGGWGVQIMFVAQAAPYLVAVAILIATVIMIFYSDDEGIMPAIIEGLLNFGFLALFMYICGYFGLI